MGYLRSWSDGHVGSKVVSSSALPVPNCTKLACFQTSLWYGALKSHPISLSEASSLCKALGAPHGTCLTVEEGQVQARNMQAVKSEAQQNLPGCSVFNKSLSSQTKVRSACMHPYGTVGSQMQKRACDT
eukprot:1157725-Pelagomonas_calceolata.AAC.11